MRATHVDLELVGSPGGGAALEVTRQKGAPDQAWGPGACIRESKGSRGRGGSPSIPHPTDNRGRETKKGCAE